MDSPSKFGPAATKACIALAVASLAFGCDSRLTDPEPGPQSVPPALFSHGSFTTSTGIYRIPFADGSLIRVSGDHHTHSPVNRIDMVGDEAGFEIVAAASGIIRGIVDYHGNSGGLGDGLAADSITLQDDDLEHSPCCVLPSRTPGRIP
jgi:hypothetical protein